MTEYLSEPGATHISVRAIVLLHGVDLQVHAST